MKLEGLNPFQLKIADHLWSIGTVDACQLWLRTLPSAVRDEALVVMELMLLAATDERVDGMTEYPDAELIIKKIKKD